MSKRNEKVTWRLPKIANFSSFSTELNENRWRRFIHFLPLVDVVTWRFVLAAIPARNHRMLFDWPSIVRPSQFTWWIFIDLSRMGRIDCGLAAWAAPSAGRNPIKIDSIPENDVRPPFQWIFQWLNAQINYIWFLFKFYLKLLNSVGIESLHVRFMT